MSTHRARLEYRVLAQARRWTTSGCSLFRTIHELRIFRVARTAEQIQESYQVAPDDLPG